MYKGLVARQVGRCPQASKRRYLDPKRFQTACRLGLLLEAVCDYLTYLLGPVMPFDVSSGWGRSEVGLCTNADANDINLCFFHKEEAQQHCVGLHSPLPTSSSIIFEVYMILYYSHI